MPHQALEGASGHHRDRRGKHRRLNEQDAYSTLRRQAMNTGQPLIQVARSVLDYAEMLKAQG